MEQEETSQCSLLMYTKQNTLLLPGRVSGYSRKDSYQRNMACVPCYSWRRRVSCSSLLDLLQVVEYTIAVGGNHEAHVWSLCSVSSSGSKSTWVWKDSSHPRCTGAALCCSAREVLLQDNVWWLLHQTPCSLPPTVSLFRYQLSFQWVYSRYITPLLQVLQSGPIYFLTPRKRTIFGVNCEALQGGDCGKRVSSAGCITFLITIAWWERGVSGRRQLNKNIMIQYWLSVWSFISCYGAYKVCPF